MDILKQAFVTGGAGDIGRAIATRARTRTVARRVSTLIRRPRASCRDARRRDSGSRPMYVTKRRSRGARRLRRGRPRRQQCRDWPFRRSRSAPRRFSQGLEVNLVGAHIVAVLAARRMVARHGGAIVNITSINAVTPGQNRGAYAAAKAGLAMHTELMAHRMGPARPAGQRGRPRASSTPDISAPFFGDAKVRAARRRGPVPTARPRRGCSGGRLVPRLGGGVLRKRPTAGRRRRRRRSACSRSFRARKGLTDARDQRTIGADHRRRVRIGAGAARRLAAKGAQVTITGRREDKIEARRGRRSGRTVERLPATSPMMPTAVAWSMRPSRMAAACRR